MKSDKSSFPGYQKKMMNDWFREEQVHRNAKQEKMKNSISRKWKNFHYELMKFTYDGQKVDVD